MHSGLQELYKLYNNILQLLLLSEFSEPDRQRRRERARVEGGADRSEGPGKCSEQTGMLSTSLLIQEIVRRWIELGDDRR